jgi:class 3 adenylate cyclase/tetratricopeptide (TPR) repeat protein
MTCPRCQAANREGARFCRECGTTFPAVCAACGATVEAGSKFCDRCGAPLAATSPHPAAAAPRFGLPESYTPKHLAEKILTSKSALEGERKQVTVLFADLKGSMELLADRDPEEARKLLDPVLERMMDAVHRYEGTVNQVMGDGIMALFGAPLAHEDHAVRACYAALRMQDSVRQYANEVRRREGVLPQIRVGLNSGEVVVRAIGSDLHMDYTAVGQTTHLAARMEQMAKPGSVLVTGDTLRVAEGYIQVRPLGAIPVKGLELPAPVYELTGTVAALSRFQASTARGLTRFVGRERELLQLRDALGRAASGHGQVVAIVGEPGVGKSRLVWEVTHSHRTDDWLILQAGAASYGKATPYLPVIDLLKAYFQVGDGDDPRAIREKVTGKLLALDRALEPALPVFLALLDVPVEDRRWEILDPPQRRLRTLDAMRRLLLRESQVQPLLIVVEDLHWIDAETQAVLDRLIESLSTARFLLLVNYRPEYRHDWGGNTAYRQLRLDPLAPENMFTLLETLVGSEAGLAPLKQLLLARTEGNPFFLEESVRSLVDEGVLAGERGAYRLRKAQEAIHVPATVQAILAARIDRLPAADKDLLEMAAVVGSDVPVAVLAAISEMPADALAGGLARLQAAEFLYETTLFPDQEYTFKHGLTHDVAYGSLLQDRRRALHARAVSAIEGCYPTRLEEHVERLAHHAVRGEMWEKAVAYLHQAGDRSMERSAYREGAIAFEQALDVLRRLPEGRAREEQTIDFHLDASSALTPVGALPKSLDHVLKAQACAEALGDERRLGWVFVYLTRIPGDNDRALEVGQRALAIATSLDDVPLRIRAHGVLGQLYQSLGDYRQAIGLLRWNVEALQGELRYQRFGGATLQFVTTRDRLAWCHAELGAFTEGLMLGEEAIRFAREVDHPHSLVFAYRSVGLVYLRRGDFLQAIPPLERAVEVCRIAQVRLPFAVTASHLGYAYALSGRLPEGVALIEEALADPTATGTNNHPLLLAYLGEAHLLASRPNDALTVARGALDLAHRQKERGNEAWILRVLAEIASQSNPPDLEPAEAHYGRALARADELGMRPLVAHCHLGLGKLYRRTGDGAKAAEHLTTATTMYRQMGMTFWLEKAEAASLED